MTEEQKPRAHKAYEELANHYAAKVDSKPHNAYYDRPAMLSLLPNIDGARVFDAGCGPGAYAEALAQRGAKIDACDISEKMLGHARERLASQIQSGNVKLHHVDLTKPLTEFESGVYRLVNAPLCLDYIEDWLTLFREFYRLLQPSGYLLFSCGHPSFDAEYFDTNDYFSVEAVETYWTGFGKRVLMPSYRRSLEEVFLPVIQAGFSLDRIHEPLPTDEFKNSDPVRYQRLMHRPGFICVRARRN